MASNLRVDKLFNIEARCIVITGGASGIGRMLARGCATNGASLVLIDINERALQDVKVELQALHAYNHGSKSETHSIETVCCDLSTEDGVQTAVRTIRSMTTSVDALVHCAAIRYMNNIMYKSGDGLGHLESATLSAPYAGWEHTFRLNVLAPYYLTAGLVTLLGDAAAKGDGRGCVIMFSSPASVHNHQFVPCYQTSKAAVDHLVRIMAAEFADFYIRVNALSPGIVPSGMTTTDANSNLHLAGETPAKRPGNEEDMVGCCLWLMSKAGAYMDGKVIRPEGGRLLILKGVVSNSD